MNIEINTHTPQERLKCSDKARHMERKPLKTIKMGSNLHYGGKNSTNTLLLHTDEHEL